MPPGWTPPFTSSPSQSVLALPELLSRILEFLDDEDHPSTALVCKTWSEESLNIYWDDLGPDDLLTLFRLLAPLVEPPDGSDALLRFERPLHTKDWVAFDKYAKRVHTIECSPDFMDRVDPSFWLEISSTRPRWFILPNLRHLVCTPQSAVISFLASNDLKSMELVGHGNHFTAANMEHSLLHVQSRMTSLRKFTLTIDKSEFEKLHPILPQLLRGFSYIRDLTMSQEYLTPTITSVLASFLHLQHLEGDLENDIPVQTQMFPASLKEGSFPSLQYLFSGALVTGIIPCLPRMTSLVKLILWSFEFELPEAYDRIIRAVASALPKLETLELVPSETSRPSDAHDHINFLVLQPVICLKNLKLLYIDHCHPMDLTSDDIISLLQGLPQLTELELSSCPPLHCDPTLNGTDLLKIVPYCHRLELLGLYLNLRTVPIYDELVLLPSLAEFVYGESCLSSDSATSVAVFLSGLLPDGCELRKGQWHKESGPPNADWQEVEKLLPAFHRARREERQRASTSKSCQLSISNSSR